MQRYLFRTEGPDDRVGRILSGTLYTQPINLFFSSLSGVAATAVAAWLAGHAVLGGIAAGIASISLVRMGCAFVARRSAGRAMRCEAVFEGGGIVYALLVGVAAAIGVVHGAPADAQLLTTGYAVSFATGASARNAGRPALALGQLFCTLLPLIAGLLTRDGTASLVLAAILTLLLPTGVSITLHIHSALRRSIAVAESSGRLAEKMKRLARGDVVTGLLNRAGLNIELVDRLSGLPPGRTFALFWIDLDKFKEVNDALGHQTGDRLLAEVAMRLRRIAPEGATLARFGGDEFIIGCEAEDRRDVQRLALEIMDELTRPMRLDRQRLEIAGSIGVAVLPDDGADLDALMQNADLALYEAKVNGRRQARFYDPAMSRKLVRRREIETELRLALQRDELSIFFQPIVDLDSGRIRSFEALVRWFHPEKGELTPDEFIPVAEDAGTIITLGNWITAQAARAAAQWPEDVTLAVNLSPLQMKAPGAALGILNALREARLDPARLELEVTEGVLLEHGRQTEAFIEELSAAGVRFALDDFGTGYSSLGNLNAYPFSKIKVDRSFVSGAQAGKKSDAIIRAVSGMATTLGMELVAEGIETVEQVSAVWAAGCTLGQGFYFSRPVPDYLAAMLLAKEREEPLPSIRSVG